MVVTSALKKQQVKQINLSDIVGKGYGTFFNFKGLEVFMQGGKGSKKSKSVALRWIMLLAQYPKACLLVLRKTGNTLLESVWSDLQWACKVYGITEWEFKKSPISAINRRTGQKIFFRGLDDWQKIASISTGSPNLHLCWAWYEEAYEIDDEDTFNRVNNSIRGKLPEGYFKQFVYSFNPWTSENYVVKKVLENITPDEITLEEVGKQQIITSGTYATQDDDGNDTIIPVERLFMITNYHLNEFLSATDKAVYEEMKEKDPARYRVEGLGMPGVEPGNIFKEEMASFNNLYDYPPKLGWKCLSVDATFKKDSKNKSKGKETDYVALQVWGISEDNQYYLTHRVKKHLSFLETCEEIDKLVSINPDLNAILIEDKANGSAIIEVMRKKYPFVIAVEPKGGKTSRAEAIAPMFESGAVHLPDAVWSKQYEDEFIAFPNGSHDRQSCRV